MYITIVLNSLGNRKHEARKRIREWEKRIGKENKKKSE